AVGDLHGSAMGTVGEELPRRDAGRQNAAPARPAGRALAPDGSIGGVLLRERRAVPPLGAPRDSPRAWRRRPGMSLYLLCGLAFSGKTTLASILSVRLPAVVVSLDAINASRGLDGGA